MTNKSLSIVLPNYNGKSLLEENLPSLYKALNSQEFQFEIIVVDDCSSDNSILFLKEKYPDILILENAANSGFSLTCNKGIQHAHNDLICIANTDVTFEKNYFLYAVRHFDTSNIFAVKGKIINYSGQRNNIINIDEKAYLYFKRGLLRFRPSYKKKDTETFDIEYCYLGCCFVADTSLIKKLGGFDPIFSPYYWEDSDLPLRALEQGFEVIYEPDSIVYHHASTTMQKTQSNLKRKIISNRNKFIFSWKHLKGKKRWVQHVFFMTMSLLSRWIILDWKFYYSFILAINRRISMPNR